MFKLRKSNERGTGEHGWLSSKHSFSFADYYDPKNMGFRDLRVINEDYIAGGRGFGAHPHRDMEIITFVVSGVLEHEDSMGNKSAIRPGEVQYMSAASGVVHSEYNKLPDEQVHLLQIWILPNQTGGKPQYGQKSFDSQLGQEKLVLAVSGDGREGSIQIRQDVDLYVSRPKTGDIIEWKLREKRGAWLQLIKGGLKVNGQTLNAGDALSTEVAQALKIEAMSNSEFILFDLN